MDLEFCKLFQVSLTNRTDVRSYVISKVSQQLLVEAGEGEKEGGGGKGESVFEKFLNSQNM